MDKFNLSPEDLHDERQWLIETILPFVTDDTLRQTWKAVSYLYPDISWPKQKDTLPTFRQIGSYFRLWAILVSKELRDVLVSIEKDSNLAHDEGRISSRNHVLFALQCARNERWLGGPCVIEPDPLTLMRIGQQRRLKGASAPFYNHLEIFLGINPYNDIDIILAEVRFIIEKHQTEIAIGDSDFYNTVQGKGRTIEERRSLLKSFLNTRFRALIIYELSLTMEPPEIERAFFGMAQRRLSSYRDESIKKLVERGIMHAKRLIESAFSGKPLQ